MATPKVTIITVVRNGREFIREAVESVLSQTYPDIEYIVKDAGSTDGTLEILAEYADRIKIVSSRDRGMYDGLNQAIALAEGDIIATLHADDFYASKDVVAHMVRTMKETGAAIGWGNLVYVDRNNPKKIVRRWKSSPYGYGKFRRGWHPPHPTFFVRTEVYEKYGLFRPGFHIAGDYELMLRFLEKYHVPSCYLPETMITMRAGGASGGTMARLWEIRREDARAWKINGLKGGWFTAWLIKPLSKIPQLFQ
jgi:glycosyltransferase involved in cell wall biosynthesis